MVDLDSPSLYAYQNEALSSAFALKNEPLFIAVNAVKSAESSLSSLRNNQLHAHLSGKIRLPLIEDKGALEITGI